MTNPHIFIIYYPQIKKYPHRSDANGARLTEDIRLAKTYSSRGRAKGAMKNKGFPMDKGMVIEFELRVIPGPACGGCENLEFDTCPYTEIQRGGMVTCSDFKRFK